MHDVIKQTVLATLLYMSYMSLGNAASISPMPVKDYPTVLSDGSRKAPDFPTIEHIVIKSSKPVNEEYIVTRSGLKLGQQLVPGTLEEARRRIWQDGGFDAHDPGASLLVHARVDGTKAVVVIEVVDAPTVASISIEGARPLSEQEVRSVLATKRGDALDQDILARDVAAVMAIYGRRGYLACLEPPRMGPKGVLTISITVVKVHSVTIEGDVPQGTNKYLDRLKTKPGRYYNSRTAEADTDTIRRAGFTVVDGPQLNLSIGSTVNVTWKVKVLSGLKSKKEANLVSQAATQPSVQILREPIGAAQSVRIDSTGQLMALVRGQVVELREVRSIQPVRYLSSFDVPDGATLRQ
jgi:hypothetical protein